MILYLYHIFVIKIFVRLDFGSASTVQMNYLQNNNDHKRRRVYSIHKRF